MRSFGSSHGEIKPADALKCHPLGPDGWSTRHMPPCGQSQCTEGCQGSVGGPPRRQDARANPTAQSIENPEPLRCLYDVRKNTRCRGAGQLQGCVHCGTKPQSQTNKPDLQHRCDCISKTLHSKKVRCTMTPLTRL